MPRTITKTIYEFNELSDRAKEKARIWFSQAGVNDDWYESTYEDAERIGLKITSFGLDRDRHACGTFTKSMPEVIAAILKEHGEICETYKTAKRYATELSNLDDENADDYLEKIEEVESEFLKALLEDYSVILQNESEYIQSDEYLDEGILANEYTFDENGKREG